MALSIIDQKPINEVSIVANIDDVLVQLADFELQKPYIKSYGTVQQLRLTTLKTYFHMECKQVIGTHPDVFNRLCEEPDFTEQVAFHQLEPYVDFALHGKYGAYKSKDYPLDKGITALQQKYQVLWRGTFTCVVHLSR